MTAHPVTGELGLRQQQAVQGPDGPDMQQCVCTGCNRRYYDTKLYFYDVVSTRCLWCEKYKKVNRVITTV